MFIAGNKESLIKIANMSFFAVYLPIIGIITHAHRHNLNMHPRDRYLIEATTGQGCEIFV